jgi:hypothetical protein
MRVHVPRDPGTGAAVPFCDEEPDDVPRGHARQTQQDGGAGGEILAITLGTLEQEMRQPVAAGRDLRVVRIGVVSPEVPDDRLDLLGRAVATGEDPIRELLDARIERSGHIQGPAQLHPLRRNGPRRRKAGNPISLAPREFRSVDDVVVIAQQQLERRLDIRQAQRRERRIVKLKRMPNHHRLGV